MRAALTEDQRRQFGNQYVQVAQPEGGPPLPPAEHARLVAWGISFLEARLALLERLVFEARLPFPGLELHAGTSLPDSSRTFEAVREDGRPTFRIAVHAEGSEQAAADALLAYLQEGVPQDAGRRFDPAARIEQPRQPPSFGDGFERRAGRRSRFSMADGPERSQGRKNTWGNLTCYRRLHNSPHPSERREWEFWRDYLFQEETLARFRPQEWLRALRVLNGLSTTQMGWYLGLQQAAYSHYENRERYTLPLQHCLTCLKHNLFHLPTQEQDPQAVEPEVARTFLAQFGHDPRFRDQLAAAIKARALTEFTDTGPNPWPMKARAVLHALTGRKKVRHANPATGAKAHDLLRLQEWQTDPARTPASDYLFVAPVEKAGTVLSGEPTEPQRTLAQRSLLSLAEQVQGIGDFLSRYQRMVGHTLPAVGRRLGVSGENVRQLHGKRRLLPRTLDRILACNAYDFPTGEDGGVHAEVRAALQALNEGRPYRNPFLTAGEAAKALSIPPMELAGVLAKGDTLGRPWADRSARQYQITAAREAWGDYWGELEQRFKQDGRLLIAGEPVRRLAG